MYVRKVTISRDDKVHEFGPDIALTKHGRLICVYRESDTRGGGRTIPSFPDKYTHVVYRISDDEGQT